MSQKNRYERLIEAIFLSHYSAGCAEFEFEREEIERFARRLRIRIGSVWCKFGKI